MESFEIWVRRAFVAASVCMFAIILGGFFVLPGIFDVEYHFPLVIELFLKLTATIATLVVLFGAVAIPALRLIHRPKQKRSGPVLISALTLATGMIFILFTGLYVKLRTCSEDDLVWHWYCYVEGKSFVAMLVLAFLLAGATGALAWIFRLVFGKRGKQRWL